MSPIEETAKFLAEKFARERAELDDFIAMAASKGVEFNSRQEAEAALSRQRFLDKIAKRQQQRDEQDRLDALVRGEPKPRGLRLVSSTERPSGDKWRAIVTVYREWLARPGNTGLRPDQSEIAAELQITGRTLTRWLRDKCGRRIEDWRDVHALVIGEP